MVVVNVEQRLAEIRVLEAAATSRPWILYEKLPDFFGVADTSYPFVQAPGISYEESEANAAFIVAMRNYLPWLLELVIGLCTEIKCDRERLEEAQEQVRELESILYQPDSPEQAR